MFVILMIMFCSRNVHLILQDKKIIKDRMFLVHVN
jgi:hypothetical protein